MWAQHAEKPRDHRGRSWSNASTSQGMARVARNLPELEAARESPWSLQRECGRSPDILVLGSLSAGRRENSFLLS